MSVQNKNRRELPFTQLWYNFSKQWEKENKAIMKAGRTNKNRNFDENTFKCMHEQISKKRLSSGHAAKRNSDFCLSNISVDNLSNISRNIDIKEKNIDKQRKHRNSVHQYNSLVLCDSKRKNSECSEQINIQINKTKTSDKVLQIIEANVIPFMVDKFIDLEQRTQKQITKMQETIVRQNKRIQTLHKQNINLQEAVIQIKNLLDFHVQSKYKKQRPSKSKIQSQVNSNVTKNKNLQNIQSSNISLTNSQQFFSNHEKSLQMINGLFQKLSNTLQQSKTQVDQRITVFQKQMKKISQKYELVEEKVQNQFADRILQLITTYNDNFVDLDKRVSNIEDTVFQQRVRVKTVSNNSSLIQIKNN